MVKKNFAKGIDAILGDGLAQMTDKRKALPIENPSYKRSEERTSIIMDSELLEKLRAIVYWDRTTIKIEVEKAIKLYLNSKEDLIVDQAVKHFRASKPNGKIKG